MTRKEIRTPQEKKRLSLERDRRNSYDESDKGSRKSIPKNKKLANRSIRRVDKNNIMMDPDLATGNLEFNHKTKWKKSPDTPLGEFVDRQKKRRVSRVNGKAWRKHKQSLDYPDTQEEET